MFHSMSRDARINKTMNKKPSLELLESRTVLNASTDFMANQQLLVNTASFDADTILVQFNPDVLVSGNIDLHGAKIVRSLELVEGLYEVEIPQGTTVAQALATFQADTRVNVAEANYNLMLERVPTDPYFNTLYGMNNVGQTGGLLDADIDATEGWDISTGTGRTIVAVIDSGVDYTHPDLAANMWRNSVEIAGDGLDNDGNGYADDIYGYDFANNDSNPMDDNGHGTHVSGTIGAVGNNGIGVAGVNWNAKIMALKFLDATGSGSTSAAISALNYAVRMGAKISNNSWGGGSYSSLLNQAITNARNSGHIFVAAAGNSASNNDVTASYPSNYTQDNVVAVAATDSRDALASFSSYGATKVDLAAPGVGIYSTLPGNKYGSYSGTSMATPHVAGALSVIWDQNPSLTYQQVIQKLYASVDKISALTGKVATGGRLNLAKALANPVTPPATDVLGAKIVSSEALGLSNGTITGFKVKFSESVQTSSFTSSDILVSSPTGVALGTTNLVAVANTNNTEFTFSIATVSAAGAYTLKVGPNVLDLAGNQMNQDGDTINGEAVQDKYSSSFSLVPVQTLTVTNSVVVVIKDLLTVTSTINITQDFLISDLNLATNVTHTYDSDMVITLKSPTGQIATLSNRRGGSGDNFVSTWFDDEATKLISAGVAPFTGSFRPETSLSVFDGKNAKGVWTLSITDKASGDVGKLTYWGLKITGNPPSTSTAVSTSPKNIRKHDLESPASNEAQQVAKSIQTALGVTEQTKSSLVSDSFTDTTPASESNNRFDEGPLSQERMASADELFSSSVGVDFILAASGSASFESEETFANVLTDAAFAA